jgi:HD-GYP domain-containing protein (c-di-GMP phosphodiesterase class II)
MRTDRSYRKALPHETAVTEMLTHSGTQFDPEVVAVLLGIVAPEVGSASPRSTAPERVAPVIHSSLAA